MRAAALWRGRKREGRLQSRKMCGDSNSWCLLMIGVPAGIDPATVLKNKNFGDATSGLRPFASLLRFKPVIAVNEGGVAEMLNLRAREFQMSELAAVCMEVG